MQVGARDLGAAPDQGVGALGGRLGLAAASVSPPMKVYPGHSYPNHPLSLHVQGECALLSLSQSHHLLQLLFCQGKLGILKAVFRGCAPKVESGGIPERR